MSVPAVTGEGTLNWAMPSCPTPGNGVGFFRPAEGANVWVEYEGGDPDYPIWSGCFWGWARRRRCRRPSPQMKVLKTEDDHGDAQRPARRGGITIETNAGMKRRLTATGLEITNNGSHDQAQGPRAVNNGALEVT